MNLAASSRGFTLVELTIALVLMAAIAALLYGSLSLAARTWDGGEAKMQQVADLRTTQTYLRSQIAAEYPQRMLKIAEFPLLFSGERDEMRYAAALPPRVAEGGVYYFRLAVVRDGDRSLLVQERMIPDVNALEPPEFRDAERSILAEGIAELRIAYFGRPADAADAVAPAWLDRWDDKQRLPMLVRIDVKPQKGPAWPTLVVEPRRSPEAGCAGWDANRHFCTRMS
jgi:general secretion pathway protein J